MRGFLDVIDVRLQCAIGFSATSSKSASTMTIKNEFSSKDGDRGSFLSIKFGD